MSNRKQRLDVGQSSSSSSPSSTNEQGKPRKRRFDDANETDLMFNANKLKDANKTSQVNPTINQFTNQNYSQQYFDLFNKRRQLPVWEYKDAFMATLEKNQVSFCLSSLLSQGNE